MTRSVVASFAHDTGSASIYGTLPQECHANTTVQKTRESSRFAQARSKKSNSVDAHVEQHYNGKAPQKVTKRHRPTFAEKFVALCDALQHVDDVVCKAIEQTSSDRQNDDVPIAKVAQVVFDFEIALDRIHGREISTNGDQTKINGGNRWQVLPNSQAEIDACSKKSHSSSFTTNEDAQQLHTCWYEDQTDARCKKHQLVKNFVEME
jgi:hypothetical protein